MMDLDIRDDYFRSENGATTLVLTDAFYVYEYDWSTVDNPYLKLKYELGGWKTAVASGVYTRAWDLAFGPEYITLMVQGDVPYSMVLRRGETKK
jgi:hypothetical protein